MDSGRGTRLVLRDPTQNGRLLRAHHPYRRVLCSLDSPPTRLSNDQHVGADVEFLEAVAPLPPLDQHHQLPADANRHEDEGIAIQLEHGLEVLQLGGAMEFFAFLIVIGLLILVFISRPSDL
ncbi:hypothetical protein VKT23_006713 [Stygiomarasmius scandens]|uniref:Uncharacterized protein n=1 Tax=Marasmiellus scandens TaxID=2682957 RepID=A0ABR1IN90_9AGAR